jgi:hypothetical protein
MGISNGYGKKLPPDCPLMLPFGTTWSNRSALEMSAH